MDIQDKKRKAALVAVAYYLEQEKVQQEKEPLQKGSNWEKIGREISMKNRMLIQRRGRIL